MTSVCANRYRWQLSVLCVLGLTAAILVGCERPPVGKTKTRKTREAKTPAAAKKTSEAKTADTEAEKTAEAKTQEVKTPEIKTEEAKTPETKTPEVKTEAKTPEVKTPEVKTAESKTPEVKTEEMKTPETKTPEVKTPEVKTEEAKTPEAKTPEVKTEAKTPEVKTPEVKTPEAKTIEAKTPEAKTEEMKTPETKTPEVKTEAKTQEAKTAEVKTETRTPGEKPAEKPAEKTAESKTTAERPKDKPAAAPQVDTVKEEKIRLAATPTPAWIPKPVNEIPEAEAKTEAEMKPYAEPIAGTDVKVDMVPIKGGKFKMGSPKDEKGHKDDEAPQHEVTIAPFWMEKHEVTWQEYELWGLGLDKQRRDLKKIQATDRDKFIDSFAVPTKPYQDMSFGFGKEDKPAICMTQFAAKMYCKWLSAKTGRYYRLPTEAEWEYACRAGTTTPYSFGDDSKKLSDYAWFTDNSDEKYHKIGEKKPNPWGLFDMYGNVSEWVLDAKEPYKAEAADNPLVEPKKEYDRVVRGGSWDDEAVKCRSATRRVSEKDWKKQDPQIPQSIWYLTDANFVGFRVVRPLKAPTADEAKKYEVDEDQLEAFKDYLESGKQ